MHVSKGSVGRVRVVLLPQSIPQASVIEAYAVCPPLSNLVNSSPAAPLSSTEFKVSTAEE